MACGGSSTGMAPHTPVDGGVTGLTSASNDGKRTDNDPGMPVGVRLCLEVERLRVGLGGEFGPDFALVELIVGGEPHLEVCDQFGGPGLGGGL